MQGGATEEQIERVARTLYELGWHETRTWDRDATANGKLGYRNRARAVLAAAGDASSAAAVLPIGDDSGHDGDGDACCGEDGPEDQGGAHSTNVTGGITPSDREKLASRLRGDILDAVPDDNDMQHVLELAAAALATPVEVDEAKLVGIVRSVIDRRPYADETRRAIRGLENAVAREVAHRGPEWLRGEGR